MDIETLQLPRNVVIEMLRVQPENVLREIFWKAFKSWDTYHLDAERVKNGTR